MTMNLMFNRLFHTAPACGCRYYGGLISEPTASVLPPQEHLRQLHRVYGPLSPAFVAQELDCTLREAVLYLHGNHAAQYVWVSLADLAQLSGVSLMWLKRWARRYHLQSASKQGQGRGSPLYIHLDDARHFQHNRQHLTAGPADALPRVKGEDLGSPSTAGQVTKAAAIEMDWHLARQAAWPVTVDRLAEAVYGSRSSQARQQTQRMLRQWETQGRVVCFARGLYDLVRPSLVLNPERYGRSVLPREDIRKLQAHHPEIAHWSARALAAAWRAYSAFYAGKLLPVADRGEPTFLEYLMVCQLNPEGMPGEVNARYEELCQAAAFHRLIPAPVQEAAEPVHPELSVENIEAGLIDFKAAAEATRLKLQRRSSGGQISGLGQRTVASRGRGVQESV